MHFIFAGYSGDCFGPEDTQNFLQKLKELYQSTVSDGKNLRVHIYIYF